MIWRRANSSSVGGSPPPYRPQWFDPNGLNVFIRCRMRSRTYANGSLYLDSGWSDWTTSPMVPTNGFATAPSGGTEISMIIEIQTGGRFIPWQIVMEDRIRNLTTNAVTYAYYTTDMTPGDTVTFNYNAGGGTSKTANAAMVLLPAEGV